MNLKCALIIHDLIYLRAVSITETTLPFPRQFINEYNKSPFIFAALIEANQCIDLSLKNVLNHNTLFHRSLYAAALLFALALIVHESRDKIIALKYSFIRHSVSDSVGASITLFDHLSQQNFRETAFETCGGQESIMLLESEWSSTKKQN